MIKATLIFGSSFNFLVAFESSISVEKNPSFRLVLCSFIAVMSLFICACILGILMEDDAEVL